MVALWLAASWAVAYRLTRRRDAPRPEPLPAVGWASLRSVRLKTRDGLELGAWYGPGALQRPVVVLLHGNGGGRAGCLDQAEFLARTGCGVLLVTLRAHGDSGGTTNDFGLSAQADVVAAVGFLERECPGRPIVVAGRSLGAAAAAFAAGELAQRVRGYVLECPYRDLVTAVRNRTRNALPWPLDLIAYLGLRAVAPVVVGDPGRLAPVEAVGEVPDNVPVLILAGAADERAGPDEATALYQRVRAHGRLVIFPGAGHLGLAQADPERYRREVLALVDAANPATAAAAAEPGRGAGVPSRGTP